jgi:hypothetical protein
MSNHKPAINGINVNKNNPSDIPENTTKIDDLEIIKKTNVISFLDESKKNRRCLVSMIDFNTKRELDTKRKYKCFWHKDYIPEHYRPIGCPIRFIPSKAVKTYHSEISKETYTIVENIPYKKSTCDKRITFEDRGYYETDGVFCSFNCCMAFIQDPENRINPVYRYSEMLLLKMYTDIFDEEAPYIIPAGHWRILEEFGGTKTIEEYMKSFNKIKYEDHGILICTSIYRLYEDQIKI